MNANNSKLRDISFEIRPLKLEQGVLTCSLFVFVLTMIIYSMTVIKEVGFGDSGEYSLQAFQFGLTHSPGYVFYSFLGHLMMKLFEDPALSTNLLSVFSSSLVSVVMCLFLFSLTRSRITSIMGTLLFALSPKIWDLAVVTEIYNVNIFFLSLSIILLFRWYKTPLSPIWLFLSALVYGFSMGISLANLLLLPAFLVLIILVRYQPFKHSIIYIFIILCSEVCIILMILDRASINPPLGTLYIPDDFENLIRYLSGIQYETLSFNPSFFFERFVQHSLIFSRNFLYIGIPIGFIGLYRLFRLSSSFAVMTLIVVTINFLYFTNLAAYEYTSMVNPSYFFFCLWVCIGIHYLSSFFSRLQIVFSLLLFGLFIITFFASQLPQKLKNHLSTPVTEFVQNSFRILPQDAVVIAPWGYFTSLLYFQTVYDQRPDLLIIELTEEMRYYSHGTYRNFRQTIARNVGKRPVCVFKYKKGLRWKYSFKHLNNNWFQLIPKNSETVPGQKDDDKEIFIEQKINLY